jgi:predicted acyl esterase
VRASFRDSSSAPTPITPGVPYEYRIAVWPTSYEFSAGDPIRVEISSCNYPQFAPNPNTGEPFGQSAVTRPADQMILHDAAQPSSVTLPVIPG